MLKLTAALLLVLIANPSFAREIEKVKFEESITEAGQTLQLNGAGLRVKRKLGMGFKVYAAGLYGKQKAANAKAWIDSAETQVLELAFLRSVDKKTLGEAWLEGFEKNCGQVDACGSEKANLKAFNDLMVDSKDGGRLRLVLDSTGVAVTMDGKTQSRGRIEGPDFRKALLAIFIGENPPTDELKKGLLGN